jgi:hypothetical protein
MDIVILSMTEEYQEQVQRYIFDDCYQMMLIVMMILMMILTTWV